MEILFRGKTKQGAWVEGYYARKRTDIGEPQSVIITGTYFGNMIYSEVIPSTEGQYTGLTDKNGTRIFEGDVYVCIEEMKSSTTIKNPKGKYETTINKWENNYTEQVKGDLSSLNLLSYRCGLGTVEVIGNIHDNPELLERK